MRHESDNTQLLRPRDLPAKADDETAFNDGRALARELHAEGHHRVARCTHRPRASPVDGLAADFDPGKVLGWLVIAEDCPVDRVRAELIDALRVATGHCL